MIVKLDGQQINGDFTTNGTLHALIDSVRSNHVSDRIIVTVAIDGQPFVDQDLTERLQQPITDATQVDLGTADPRELCGNVFFEIANRLQQIGENVPQIAQILRTGDFDQSADALRGFLSVWDECRRALIQCSGLLQTDLTLCTCEGRPAAEFVQDLSGNLRELRDGFEARDAVLLADLMQYEAPQLCTTWSKLLRSVGEQIKQGSYPQAEPAQR